MISGDTCFRDKVEFAFFITENHFCRRQKSLSLEIQSFFGSIAKIT